MGPLGKCPGLSWTPHNAGLSGEEKPLPGGNYIDSCAKSQIRKSLLLTVILCLSSLTPQTFNWIGILLASAFESSYHIPQISCPSCPQASHPRPFWLVEPYKMLMIVWNLWDQCCRGIAQASASVSYLVPMPFTSQVCAQEGHGFGAENLGANPGLQQWAVGPFACHFPSLGYGYFRCNVTELY